MSIRVHGTITIQRKSSPRGAFNVGDLDTEVGVFEVKDSLIEEFEPGKYSGEFLIRWIAPDSFTWRGRVFVKNRATLEAIYVDDEDGHPPAPATPPEPDPIDQASPLPQAPPTPAQAPALAPARAPAAPANATPPAESSAQLPSDGNADLELLGDELNGLVAARQPVKLDPTVDRQQFRRQRDRLKELGYHFDAKSQTWLARSSQ